VSLGERYEQGFISSYDFINQVSSLLGEPNTDQVTRLWNSIITHFPPEHLGFVEKLAESGNFRLFLLSNTNALHIEFVQHLMTAPIYQRFKQCFEGFYLSHELGLRKPDPAIFNYVLKHHRLHAAETLFIDDTLEHIESAALLGLKTWHLKVGKESVHALKYHL
jgi:putative hydrolase of the HAD superfamily